MEDPVIVCEDNGVLNSPEKGEEDGDSSLRERLEVTMEDDDKSYIGEMESGGDSVLGESINEDDKSCSSKAKYGVNLKKEKIRQGKDFSRITEMSGEKIFACMKCNFKAKNLTSLRVHIEYDHRGTPRFRCDFCVYEANRKATIQRHVKKMHTFACQKCPYVGEDNMDLKSHINDTHKQPIKMTFSCGECDYTGKCERHLNSHIRLAHPKDEAEIDEKLFPCEDCDYVGRKKCNLMTHIKCHIPITTIK